MFSSLASETIFALLSSILKGHIIVIFIIDKRDKETWKLSNVLKQRKILL